MTYLGNEELDESCGGLNAGYGCCYNPNNNGGNDGSGSGTTTESSPYTVDDDDFERGYTKRLEEGEELRFKIEKRTHTLEVLEITDNTVTIEVKSNPQTATMKENALRNFELTGDGYYDLQVTIRDIASDNARIEVKYLHEKITSEQQSTQKTSDTSAKQQKKIDLGTEAESDNGWIYLLVIIIISIAFIGLLIYLAYRRRY
jgi:hypothetical protein